MEGPEPVAVQLQSLPAPDTLEFSLPPGHVCLVSGDGSKLTAALVRSLADRGWPVVLLHSADLGDITPGLPVQVPVVTLAAADESALRDALIAVEMHGPVGTVVILQPPTRLDADSGVGAGASSWDIAPLRVPFLLAKHLQPSLTGAVTQIAGSRAAFVTVLRLDGALGVTGRIAGSPVSAGILGMTKSLRLEWPEVFCRAIDLDPAMAADAAADAVMAELFDPDRLTAEVGLSSQGRVTLTAGSFGAGGVA